MKKFFVYFITVVVTAITTVFALNTLNVSAAEVTVTTVADLVRELKALPQEEGASVRFSTKGVSITYKYEFVDENELRAMLAAAEVLYPSEYDAFMTALEEKGLTIPDVCGWQLNQTTIQVTTIGWYTT